jgi:chromosome segregation ATPase
MSATVVTLQSNNITETVDFLRRLASMMAGGRNAELLLQAAAMIDALTRRALTAEELYRQQQDQTAKILALRDVAEMATDNLMAEVDVLKTQMADAASHAEAERAQFAEDARRLQALADDAEARHSKVEAELADLRARFDALGASAVMVPMDTLRLALAQFGHLADSFARSGDIISQTICAIGTCTIEQAISGGQPAEPAQ